jgi:hypothetical protein
VRQVCVREREREGGGRGRENKLVKTKLTIWTVC